MKKTWRILLALAVMVLLTCAAFATDVTFSYTVWDDGVKIEGITIADDAEGPIEVVIPAEFEGEAVTKLDIQNIAPDTAAKIGKISFEGKVPVIHGNLFNWRYEKNWLDLESNGYGFARDSYYPDTVTLLKNIPNYITRNYNYDSDGDGESDTYYAGENLVRVDESYVGDLAVKDGTVSILAGAMEGCTGLREVTLPDSIEWIGVRAFANSGVTSVNIPKGLLTDGSKEIQMQTFFGCDNLQTVTFPDGADKLSKVGYLAFYGCESLAYFDFNRVGSISTLSFAKALAAGTEIDLSETSISSTAAVFSHSGVGSVTFGEATGGDIPFEAFYSCKSLTEIDGMETVGAIYAWAFANCTSLKQDVLADCTEKDLYLGKAYRAFANNAMTEITIPATVTYNMAGGIFAGNEQLEAVNWYCTSEQYSPLFAILNWNTLSWSSFKMPGEPFDEATIPKTLNVYAQPYSNSYLCLFFNMPYLETVNIEYEATSIPKASFQFCPNLKEINFRYPEKITEIGENAFMGCLSLTSFPFTEMTELQSIGKNAFMLKDYSRYTAEEYDALSSAEQAYGLKEIDLSGCTKLTNIEEAAFYNQYSATKLHLPAGCYNGNRGIFNGTVSMTELICDGDLDKNMIAKAMITSISGYNDNLETVTVKGQVAPSENAIFFDMDALKTVNLPNAISIPEKCFMNCTALETVNAPKVETVGNHAFFGSGLKETVISSGVTYGDYVFMNSALEKVVVEEGVTELGDFMFEGCTAMEQVSLPSTLETVNWAAFKNANAITIDIPASVRLIEDDAFWSGSFSLIFRGTPTVELVHEIPDVGLNTWLPISSESVIYYTNDDSKTAAEVYAASLPEDVTAPAIKPVGSESELVITGAPTEVTAGTQPDLQEIKVTYNGIELTPEQYSLDYDAEDTTVGVRTVTVTVTDNTLPEMLKESTISAKGLSSETVDGKVYTIGSSDESTGTFTLEVKEEEKPDEPIEEPETPTYPNPVIIPTYPIINTTRPSTSPSASKYPPTVTQPDKGGSVTVSPAEPAEGDNVIVTSQPDEGYEVEDVNVTDKNGKLVAVTEKGDGIYSFTQPAGNVTVNVTFIKKSPVVMSDVPSDAYYYDAVYWAVENGITNGTGDGTTFSPDDPCTRAQMVTFLWRAAGCPDPENMSSFTDVSDDAYYAKAVTWALENGITGGVGDNRFAPDDVCTRAQMAAFLCRMAGGKAVSSTIDFIDVSADEYYAEAVQWAVENGITNGTGDGTTFSPDAVCTRGQMVTFLYRFFVK